MLTKNYILFTALAIFMLGSCSARDTGSGGSTAKRYPFKGEIVTVDKAAKKASIKHEKIEGYMDPMTMDFEIRKPDWVWDELAPGTVVTGELVVDNVNNAYWVEVSGVIAAPNKGQPDTPLLEDKFALGKPLIDFSLTNQDGLKITPEDFKGKALAITFIYAECPLPDFCILMSKNFSDAANSITADGELKNKVRLLSVSFDPARDTPQKLKSYGIGYLGKDSKASDFSVWQLAVGDAEEIRKVADFAGLQYEVDKKDKTQFNHSLRTLIVAPDGKVTKVLKGNDWTPDDLIGELKTTLK